MVFFFVGVIVLLRYSSSYGDIAVHRGLVDGHEFALAGEDTRVGDVKAGRVKEQAGMRLCRK